MKYDELWYTRENTLHKGKYHLLLDSIALLSLNLTTYSFTCLVESKPVKKVSRVVVPSTYEASILLQKQAIY